MPKRKQQSLPKARRGIRSTRSRLPSVGDGRGRRGRPSVYSQDLADKICWALVEGNSLRSVCTSPDMPDVMTVMGWAMDPEHDFYLQYKEARIKQAELKIDELDDLAKSALGKLKPTPLGAAIDPAAVSAIKLLIDTRKWAASKVFPKVYGNRLEIEHKQQFIPLSELAQSMARRVG